MLTLRIVVTLLTSLLMYAKLLIISGIFSQDTFFSVPYHQGIRQMKQIFTHMATMAEILF